MLTTQATIQARAHRKRSGSIGGSDQKSDEEGSIRDREGKVFAKLYRAQVARMMLMRQTCIAVNMRHGNRRNQHDGEIITVCLFRMR